MLQALMAGVASLQAQQTQMNVIGNNLANANTTAFKSSTLSFEDMLSQTVSDGSPPTATDGGTNPEQFGLGVAIGATTTNMSQGSLESTNVSSDLAIQGNGFFAVTNGTGISYTRDGSFSVDANGYLVQNSTGERLLGWPADSAGVINSSSQITASNELQIPLGTAITAQATANVNLSGNLDASSTSSYTWSTQMQVYNSLGASQTVTVVFSNPQSPPPAAYDAPTGATSSWDWTAYAGSAATGTPIGSSTTTGNAPMFFDANGQYVNPLAAGASNEIVVPASGGASADTINLNMGAITQLDASSSVDLGSQDGVGPGTLDSYSVGSDGVITGVFANGLARPLGQVALTTFSNPNGLLNQGNNLWSTSINSGAAVSGPAGSGSAGSLNAGYLEQSNVDVGTQLTSLIVCQQGYEANTKIITTVNQMFQALEQMIQ